MSEKRIPVNHQETAPTRLTVRGKYVLGMAAAGLAVGAVLAAGAGMDALKAKAAEDRADRIEQAESNLSTFTETGELPEGMVAIRSAYHGTAWDYARTIGAEDSLRGLRADIALQSDMQGYSGVESGEIYIVDQDAVTPEAVEQYGVSPEEILEK